MLFSDILNKMDVVAILEIYSMACKREAARLDEEFKREIGPVSGIIQ